MAKTYTQQLDDVQAAIDKIEGSFQKYKVSSGSSEREGEYARLQVLYSQRETLETKVAREARGGIRVRGVTRTR